MRNIFYFFSLLVLLQTACNKHKSQNVAADYLLVRSLGFYLEDSVSGQNLIGRNGERYHPDSIKVYSIGHSPSETGRILTDSIGKYWGSIIYLFATLPNPEYVSPLKYSNEVVVYLNQFDSDTFFIDKQSGQGFAYYFNKVHLMTVPAIEDKFQLFLIKK